MWPMLLDYSDDECRRILRKLELEAYASIISAFRAQGELNKEKKKMLQDLSVALSISIDRHRAEIRRAINDEHLNTIADRVAGPNTTADWAIEGRRVVPLMPRAIPQTAYLSVANYAADAQAAKNATLPVPSATGSKGYQREIMGNGEHSRKRCSSPADLHSLPEKFVVLDHSPIIPTSCNELISEENSSRLCQSSSPVSRCVLSSPVSNETASYVHGTRSQTQSAKLALTNQKMLNVTSLKNTTSSPSCHSLQHAKSSLASVSNSADNLISPNEEPQIMPNNSTFTQAVSTLPSPVTSTFVTRPRSKLPAIPKTLMRPRLSPGSSFNPVATQPVLYQNSSPQLSTSNLLHKNISPLKFRSSITTTSSPHSQATTITAASALQTQPQSTHMPRVVNAHRTPSPVLLKQSQPSVTLNTITKSTVSAKILAKPTTVRTTVTPRAMVTSVTKAPIQKTTPVVVSSSPISQQQQQPMTVKTSYPAHILGNAKSSATITYSQKVLPGPSQTKVTTQGTVAKAIHYRNDGGLKIISQNMSTNRLLPKLSNSGSTQCSTSTMSRFITTTSSAGITGSARIVNFSQPVTARFARALPPSSIAAANLVNSLPVSGLRVTVPVGNTSMVRTALPAKPNVIVVHKAQVWPQTPSATIVMTSSGSFTRLSSEAIEEAVTLVQRQEPARAVTVATAGLKSIPVHHIASSSGGPVVQTKAIQAASCKIVEIPSGEITTIRTHGSQAVQENVAKVVTPDSGSHVEIISEKKADVPTVTASAEKVSESSAVRQKGQVSENQDGDDEKVVKHIPPLHPKPEAIKKTEMKTSYEVIPCDVETVESNASETTNSESNKAIKQIAQINFKDSAASHFNIPDFNLDQLQEGQILELQAQDAAELLSQHGHLSTEVIELLQEAGLQVERVQVSQETHKADEQECIELDDDDDDDDSQQSVKEILLKPKLQTETIETSILTDDIEIAADETTSAQAEAVEQVEQRSDVESHNEEIYVVAETSNEVAVTLIRPELTSLQATESLGNSSASQSPQVQEMDT